VEHALLLNYWWVRRHNGTGSDRESEPDLHRAAREFSRLARDLRAAARAAEDVAGAAEYRRDLESIDFDEIGRLVAEVAAARSLLEQVPRIPDYLGVGGLEEDEIFDLIAEIEKEAGYPQAREIEGEAPTPDEVRARREELSRDRSRAS
jgi:hypothetical protein